MRILAFTKGNEKVPSSNFRVWILSRYLKEAYGWKFETFHSISYRFWSFDKRRFKIWKDVIQNMRHQKPDILFIHKVHFPFDIAVLILILKYWWRVPLVYDIDDPQWRNSRAQDFIMSRIADRIFCSSRPFFEHYKQINPNVVLVPTVIEGARYASHRKTSYNILNDPVLGWVGDGMGHFRSGNFHIIKPALEKLSELGYRIAFRIIGTKGYKPLEEFMRSDKYMVEFIAQVPFEDIPRQIQGFDIGLAPVVDTEWFQINATAKGVEYMACGVPVVASPVGAYNDLIKEGENGFLAASTEEWVQKIEQLLRDVSLRKQIGEAGFKTVSDGYSYAAILPLVKNEFETLCRLH